MRKVIPYNPKLKPLASRLRNEMTLSEVLLWNELKQRKMLGYDFDRQKPLDNFIVDFFCKDLYLAIEIDGDSRDHEESYKADNIRQRKIEAYGIRFLRFNDSEVKQDMKNVVRTLQLWIERHGQSLTHPLPLQGGE